MEEEKIFSIIGWFFGLLAVMVGSYLFYVSSFVKEVFRDDWGFINSYMIKSCLITFGFILIFLLMQYISYGIRINKLEKNNLK